jgi:hypothetical protein
LLERELQSIQELAELEEGEATARWPLDALVHLHSSLATLSADDAPRLLQAAMAMCMQLKALDPDRRARYAYLGAVAVTVYSVADCQSEDMLQTQLSKGSREEVQA